MAGFTWRGEELKEVMDKVGVLTSHAVGLHIEGMAKDLCQVKSGRCRDSISTRSEVGSSRMGSMAESEDQVSMPSRGEIVVGTNVIYAPRLEFIYYPFMRPAVDMAKGEALQIVERNGRKEFAKYIKELEE